MTTDKTYYLPDPDATEALGRHLAARVPEGGIAISLGGPLGAGKSSLARAMLRGLGVTGAIPSPTYTLVEPYTVHGREAYHVDLYRIGDAEELEMLGLSELGEGAVLLVEWPERDAARRLRFDLDIALSHHGEGRDVRLEARSPAGEVLRQSAAEWLA